MQRRNLSDCVCLSKPKILHFVVYITYFVCAADGMASTETPAIRTNTSNEAVVCDMFASPPNLGSNTGNNDKIRMVKQHMDENNMRPFVTSSGGGIIPKQNANDASKSGEPMIK